MNPEDNLRALLNRLDSAVLGFSGGVDSSLLAYSAHQELGDRFIALTMRSALMTESELVEAHDFCARYGIAHVFFDFDVRAISRLMQGAPDRCYYCKQAIFTQIGEYAQAQGYRTVMDGSNRDDDPAKRPGMRALRELSVRSPLREAGFSKDMIRSLSKELKLPTWNKPAAPCLSIRSHEDFLRIV